MLFGRKLAALFGRSHVDQEFLDDLEELLIEGDFGARAATEVVEELRAEAGKGESRDQLLGRMRVLLGKSIRTVYPTPSETGLTVLLVLGVNGVGKTTTIAKLAHHYRQHLGADDIVLCAADTFRAAAVEQLELHGKRQGLRVVSQKQGADPGAVIYDAVTSAISRKTRLLLIDTAGRMHSRGDLVKELVKIDKVIQGRGSGLSVYHKMLVIDATTGQNALQQAEVFHQAIGLDSVVLAKSDSTAKGGVVVPISRALSVPFAFRGVGEGLDDLVVFDRDEYLEKLLGIDG